MAGSGWDKSLYQEGRIQQRMMTGNLLLGLLGFSVPYCDGQAPLVVADRYVQNWLAQQATNGGMFQSRTETNSPPYSQLNYMEALRVDALLRYRRYRGASQVSPSQTATFAVKSCEFRYSRQRVQPTGPDADGQYVNGPVPWIPYSSNRLTP